MAAQALWLTARGRLIGLALFDAISLVSLYSLLFRLRIGQQSPQFSLSALTLAALWLTLSYLLGRYSRPEFGRRESLRQRLATTLLVAGLVLVLAVVGWHWSLRSGDPRTFRGFLLPLLGSTAVLSAAAQVWLWRQRPRRQRWLIVADPPEAEVIARELEISPLQEVSELSFRSPQDLEADSDVQAFLNEVDGIAVSEGLAISDSLAERILIQRSKRTSVCSLLLWAERHLQRVPPELFTSRGLLQVEGFDLHPGRWRWRLKRFGDLALGSILLVLTLPLLAIAALLIRLEDGGPLFYSQVRTGLYGQPFTIWKLRSMRVNAEALGARWAQRQDPRITRIGRWLRQWRLDELPQLFAVLSGEMSLIGPRPERPELEVHLEAAIPHYRLRHCIRPGLSGWAQVCFPYGASTADSRIKLSYDLYYLRNASLLFDILILFKTIRLVLGGHGAIPQPLQPRQRM